MDNLETTKDTSEVVNNEETIETAETTNAIVTVPEDQQNKDQEPTIESLAKQAAYAITQQVASGDKTFSEAAGEFLEAGAIAQAAKEHGDEYSKIKHKELKGNMEADASSAAANKTYAGNTENEAFYQRFRPVLEFDFSHITGDGKKKSTDVETKSYSKMLMILTLIIATIPYLAIALVLYVLKGINSIVELISQFTVAARRIIAAGFILLGAYIVYMVAAYFVEFYTGIKLPLM